MNESAKHALAAFRKHGGMLRTKEALAAGIHPRTLNALRDEGKIDRLLRGIYRLATATPFAHPDLVAVALRVPKGVICLISALSFHDLTTEIPHEVYVAVPRGTEPPQIDYPPVRTFWFSGPAFSEGIETHRFGGVPVGIYCREKTIVDCFYQRNRIGLDVFLECLREYKLQRNRNVEALFKFASIRRVARTIRPYLEAILWQSASSLPPLRLQILLRHLYAPLQATPAFMPAASHRN